MGWGLCCVLAFFTLANRHEERTFRKCLSLGNAANGKRIRELTEIASFCRFDFRTAFETASVETRNLRVTLMLILIEAALCVGSFINSRSMFCAVQ